uniref:Uncharacterized protein n=1 Tax=Amphimedon queenslandica TaxID=400682 RepID=A0A1X7VJF7_AMPQE
MFMKLVDFIETSVIEKGGAKWRRKERGGTREMLKIGLIRPEDNRWSLLHYKDHLLQERARIQRIREQEEASVREQ